MQISAVRKTRCKLMTKWNSTFTLPFRTDFCHVIRIQIPTLRVCSGRGGGAFRQVLCNKLVWYQWKHIFCKKCQKTAPTRWKRKVSSGMLRNFQGGYNKLLRGFTRERGVVHFVGKKRYIIWGADIGHSDICHTWKNNICHTGAPWLG